MDGWMDGEEKQRYWKRAGGEVRIELMYISFGDGRRIVMVAVVGTRGWVGCAAGVAMAELRVFGAVVVY